MKTSATHRGRGDELDGESEESYYLVKLMLSGYKLPNVKLIEDHSSAPQAAASRQRDQFNANQHVLWCMQITQGLFTNRLPCTEKQAEDDKHVKCRHLGNDLGSVVSVTDVQDTFCDRPHK